jgi:phosphatidylglycerophosphate synthase
MMSSSIRRRPYLDSPLLRSAGTNAGLGLVALLGLAWGLDRVLALGPWYLPKALLAYALVLLLLGFLRDHRPHERLGPANQVTLLRGVLTALLAGLVGEGGAPAIAWTALALGLAASALDGVDGWLARRGGWASPFGARFDMETDALLIAVLALLVWSLGKAGVWVLAAGLMRYAFVAAAYLLPWLARPLPPSRRRQAVCVVQVLSLTLALTPILAPATSAALAAAGLVVLIYSFAVDVHWLARHAGPEPSTGETR